MVLSVFLLSTASAKPSPADNDRAEARRQQLLNKHWKDLGASPLTEKNTLVAYLWELLEEKTLAEGEDLIISMANSTLEPPLQENQAIGFVVLRLWIDKIWETKSWTRSEAQSLSLNDLSEFYKNDWKIVENFLFSLMIEKHDAQGNLLEKDLDGQESVNPSLGGADIDL